MTDLAYPFTVETGHVALYARAVGDLEAGYPDATGNLVIPPTYLSSSVLFDPASPSRALPAEEARPASAGMAAEVHFEYHRPARMGERLTVTRRAGNSWQKSGKRGGTLSFTESVTEYMDSSGDLVCTIRRVAVTTERAISTDNACLNA